MYYKRDVAICCCHWRSLSSPQRSCENCALLAGLLGFYTRWAHFNSILHLAIQPYRFKINPLVKSPDVTLAKIRVTTRVYAITLRPSEGLYGPGLYILSNPGHHHVPY